MAKISRKSVLSLSIFPKDHEGFPNAAKKENALCFGAISYAAKKMQAGTSVRHSGPHPFLSAQATLRRRLAPPLLAEYDLRLLIQACPAYPALNPSPLICRLALRKFHNQLFIILAARLL